MGKFYYFNKNIDKKGNHEVHEEKCSRAPHSFNMEFIGHENDCHIAIQRAKRQTGKSNFDGCYYCCNQCHTG